MPVHSKVQLSSRPRSIIKCSCVCYIWQPDLLLFNTFCPATPTNVCSYTLPAYPTGRFTILEPSWSSETSHYEFWSSKIVNGSVGWLAICLCAWSTNHPSIHLTFRHRTRMYTLTDRTFMSSRTSKSTFPNYVNSSIHGILSSEIAKGTVGTDVPAVG